MMGTCVWKFLEYRVRESGDREAGPMEGADWGHKGAWAAAALCRVVVRKG